jgi:hypothetical protein
MRLSCGILVKFTCRVTPFLTGRFSLFDWLSARGSGTFNVFIVVNIAAFLFSLVSSGFFDLICSAGYKGI